MYIDAIVIARIADLERERDQHVEEGRNLRALADSAHDRGALRSTWQESNGTLRLRWNLAALRRESQSRPADEAA